MILHTTAHCITHPPCEWTGSTDKSAEKHGRETGHATIVETVPKPAPRRVQMSRKHPWRAEHPDAVIVARPSRWGNPYRVVRAPAAWFVVDADGRPVAEADSKADGLRMAVEFYRNAITDGRLVVGGDPWFTRDGGLLTGRDLACWCPLPKPGQPDICHGAVLLEIANAPENEAS